MSNTLTDYVRIPKSFGDTTGKWVAKYAHPWTVVSPSLTIGPVSLNFSSFIRNEYEWRMNLQFLLNQ